MLAMELPGKQIKKRAGEEIEQEKPTKVPALEVCQEKEIEKLQEEEWKQKSEFEQLPDEIKQHIFSYLTTSRGATKEARLHVAAENIRSLVRTSKVFQLFLDDQQIAGYLFHELAKNYVAADPKNVTPKDLVTAALALQTAGAGRWLNGKAFVLDHSLVTDIGKQIINKFFMAAQDSDWAKLNFLIRYIPNLITSVNDKNWTLLQVAADSGDLKLVNFAIDAYKAINRLDLFLAPTPQHTSPLSFAAFSGNVAVFDLIYNNIPINYRTFIVQSFNQEGYNVLHMAVGAKGHSAMIDRVRQLPEIGFLVNQADRRSNNPLMVAIANDDLDAVERLVAIPGIALNFRGPGGATALIQAVKKFNVEMIKMLLNQPNIDVNIEDIFGRNAFYYSQYQPLPTTCAFSPTVRNAINKLLRQHGAH